VYSLIFLIFVVQAAWYRPVDYIHCCCSCRSYSCSDQSFVSRLKYGVYYKAKFGVKLVTNKWTHVVKLELPVVNETAYANLLTAHSAVLEGDRHCLRFTTKHRAQCRLYRTVINQLQLLQLTAAAELKHVINEIARF